MGWFSDVWKKVKSWFTPKQPKPPGFNIEQRGVNKVIPVIYGFVKKAKTIKVLRVTTDSSGGATNEYLHMVCIVSEGEVENLGTVYFNGISEDEIDNERYYIERFTGADDQAHCATLSNHFSKWKNTAKLSGLAYVYVRLKMNKKNTWWQGEPEITVDVAGKKVLDVRDSNVKFSMNPALCVYDYATNNRYGKGLDASKLIISDFSAAAELAKTPQGTPEAITQTSFNSANREWESIDLADTWITEWASAWLATNPGFDDPGVNGIFNTNLRMDTSQNVKENLEELLGGFRAIFTESNGQYSLKIEKDDDPVYTFDVDNLVGAIETQPGSNNERYNRVVIKYRSRLTGEEDEIFYPEDNAQYQVLLSEDNGKELDGEFTFDSIHNKAEAIQMGKVILNRSREMLGARWQGTPETLVVEVGDVVELNSQIMGWVNKPFRVESKDIDYFTGQVSFQGVEHQPSIYPWAVSDAPEEFVDTSFALPSDIDAPNGLSYAPDTTGRTLGRISWANENNALVSEYQVTVKKGETVVISTTTSEQFVDVANIGGGAFTAEVSAKNSLFASDPAVLAFTIAAPVIPTSITVTTKNTAISLRPEIDGGIPSGVSFEFEVGSDNDQANAENKGKGRELTMQSLLPAKEYFYWVRSSSDGGVSMWVSGSATTTKDRGEILEQFDGAITRDDLDESTQELIKQIDRTEPNNLPDRLRSIEVLSSNTEQKRQESEKAVFDTLAGYVFWRNEYERRTLNNETLINASVDVDPETGQISLKANAYTDEQFTQASILVNGVDAKVGIQAERITASEDRITSAESSITVLSNEVNLKTSTTEVNQIVSGAIDALTPAYSWQFNSGSDGFTGGTYQAAGYIEATNGNDVTNNSISFEADENPVIRLRVKLRTGGTWTGSVTLGDATALLDAPESENEFVNIQKDLSGLTDYTGTITSIALDLGDVDIYSVEIGKRGANDQVLTDIEIRTSQLEFDMNSEGGKISTLASTQWVTDKGYQTSSAVNELINTFDTTYSITATLTQLDSSGTVEKANAAQTWIDGADATITDLVAAYVTDNSIPDGTKITQIEQSIDGVNGRASTAIASVAGLDKSIKDTEAAQIDALYKMMLFNHEGKQNGIKLSYAEQELQAQADEQESLATSLLDLTASHNQSLAQYLSFTRAFANEKQLTAERFERLSVEMGEGEDRVIAEAKEYTRTSIGYCIDADGNITDETNAVACVATEGCSWVDGPLAEFVRDLSINGASLSDIRQVFETKGGKLVARGGMLSDVKGRLSGWVNTNDGSVSNFDVIADNHRVGIVVDDVFIPLFYLDLTQNPPQLVFKGRAEFGDYTVQSKDDIRALDGYTLVKRYSSNPIGSEPSGYDKTVKNPNPAVWFATPAEANAEIVREGREGLDCVWEIQTYKIAGNDEFAPDEQWSDAYRYTPEKGEKGDSVKGDPGLSAYEVWLNEGNTGSIQDFLDDLNGSDGVDGNTWHSGTSNPVGSLGKVGDFYLKANRYVYEKTANAVWTYRQDLKGIQGTSVKGDDGERGSKMFGITARNGVFPNDATTVASDMDVHLGLSPVNGDVLTYRNADGTVTSTQQFNGTVWELPGALFHGSVVATGSMAGEVLIAGTRINTPYLDAGTGTFAGVLELGSAVIKTEYNTLAKLSIDQFRQVIDGSTSDKTVEFSPFYSPNSTDVGNSHQLRFGHFKQDLIIKSFIATRADRSDSTNLYIDLKYKTSDGQEVYQTIASFTLNGGGNQWGTMPYISRITTRDDWLTCQIRVRASSANTDGKPLALTCEVHVDNTSESGYDAGTATGSDNSSGDTHVEPPNPIDDYRWKTQPYLD